MLRAAASFAFAIACASCAPSARLAPARLAQSSADPAAAEHAAAPRPVESARASRLAPPFRRAAGVRRVSEASDSAPSSEPAVVAAAFGD